MRAARAIGEICADAMRKLKYLGAGTIEFLYEDGEFYFIEMNTRLQVEHPVTEAITGIDLVREQIRIASGAPLALHPGRRAFSGHAIECRINAENPRPSRPRPARSPISMRRAASACASIQRLYAGYRIPPYYDSLIGKLIVHGKTRNECMMRLRRALDEFVSTGASGRSTVSFSS
jgi:acetyl-CoA carboxylase biotin carboxylase subunit